MASRRPAGVTIAAIAAILGSGLFILMGLVTLMAALNPTRQNLPLFLAVVSYVMCAVMLGFAAWGITTSVGLFRMRAWSRWSVLVFSSLLAVIGGMSALMIAIIPLPPTPQVSDQIMTGIKMGIAIFYGGVALIGAFWLYYFNTARVRTQFGSGALSDGPGGRPLSVSIIAWVLLIGGLMCILMTVSSFPGMVFGLVFTGWTARAFYLVFGGIEIWIGLGLLRLDPRSRLAAIVLCGYGILNGLLFVMLPSSLDRLRAIQDFMPFGIQPPAGYDPFATLGPSLLFGSLISLVPIWFLVARRKAFAKQPSPPPLPS